MNKHERERELKAAQNEVGRLRRDMRGWIHRWEKMRPLIEEVMRWHSDRGSGDYNGCDKSPCMWCSRARQALEREDK